MNNIINELSDKEVRLSYLLHSKINKKITQSAVDEILELHRDICNLRMELIRN